VRVPPQAAFEVTRRTGYEDASVAEILEEAGLSTRSFYRHFQSKHDSVLALFRINAEAAAQRLEVRVAAAASPREGLEGWMDDILSFVFKRKFERVALLGCPAFVWPGRAQSEPRR
jgi:AcrR family transcriptional regulator